jgi:cytochrome P450/NADPH-cytochrome P450 reductase
MHLTIAKLHRGRVSTALANASMGETFLGRVQSSKFRLPTDPAVPIILIGTGTGIAPLRGFLQHRVANKDKNGPLLGIFGFRSPDEHLYADELATTFAASSNEFIPAYSRVEPRQHVQDVIAANAEKVVALLEQGGSVFVCGSHDMGKEAGAAIGAAAEKVKSLPAGEGEAYLAKLKKELRFVADTYQQGH